jgi:hypothetical protein
MAFIPHDDGATHQGNARISMSHVLESAQVDRRKFTKMFAEPSDRRRASRRDAERIAPISQEMLYITMRVNGETIKAEFRILDRSATGLKVATVGSNPFAWWGHYHLVNYIFEATLVAGRNHIPLTLLTQRVYATPERKPAGDATQEPQIPTRVIIFDVIQVPDKECLSRVIVSPR